MNDSNDIRWKQRFENFEKAYLTLKENTKRPIKTELERAGLIQLFEMAFELSWKVLKDYLEGEGYVIKGPRNAIKQAFQIGLIEDGRVWLEALSDRNLTTHTSDEKLAERLITSIREKCIKLYQRMSKDVWINGSGHE